jgi:CO/xanthine dehydrogenase FAD-binding subunit
VLAEVGPRGKVLAGGQSLVPLLNMRLAAPAHLVDVSWLAELDEVATDAAVRVSALSEPVLRVGCCGRFGARYDADAHLPCSAVPLAADRPGRRCPGRP